MIVSLASNRRTGLLGQETRFGYLRPCVSRQNLAVASDERRICFESKVIKHQQHSKPEKLSGGAASGTWTTCPNWEARKPPAPLFRHNRGSASSGITDS